MPSKKAKSSSNSKGTHKVTRVSGQGDFVVVAIGASNPSVFDALKSLVFPAIMKRRTADKVLRVWTPACASGEETYSIAIAMLEYLGDKASQVPIQFFGTDVSEASISKARAGAYPENIQGDVSADRLRRFFNKVEGGFRISKSIRDMCIFAQHNLLNDPPFSQMDLICCRNLLIYLEPVLQNKAISLFHYATRPYGFLVLGASEGLGSAPSLFNIEDRTHKIFSKKTSAVRQVVTFSLIDRATEWNTARCARPCGRRNPHPTISKHRRNRSRPESPTSLRRSKDDLVQPPDGNCRPAIGIRNLLARTKQQMERRSSFHWATPPNPQ